jgi:glucose/arabinose dehydrogenase
MPAFPRTHHRVRALAVGVALAVGLVSGPGLALADHGGPHVHDPNLRVRTVVGGLTQPTTLAFIGPNDFLVNEKPTGRVMRVTNGTIVGPVLDLAVNSASERGLLGMTLHRDFPAEPYVYLYWTESLTGADTSVTANVDLLANRVDRFAWDGATLTFDRNLIRLRAYQADAGQPLRGNHDGGVLSTAPDGRIFILIGDVGRRGWMQNLPCGPTPTCPGPTVPDDQYGGPEPDDAHLTGVILRLNPDGTTPSDNPFHAVGAAMGGEAGANIQKVYAYGVRNSFGMAIDPKSGALWHQENGDDTFSEINRTEPGMNSGWIQTQGPVSRVAEYKAIEVNQFGGALQQIRWPPTNIQDTPEAALDALFMLPGAHYSAPELAWRYEVAPGGIGFVDGRGLGPQYDGDLFMGGAVPVLEGGHLFHLNITGNRLKVGVDDPRLEDRVADNFAKYDITESESLLFGTNFGTVTDIETAPSGTLYVVSLSTGTIFEIHRR